MSHESPAATRPHGRPQKEAQELGADAYIYGHPLVTMEMTRRVMTHNSWTKRRPYPGRRRIPEEPCLRWTLQQPTEGGASGSSFRCSTVRSGVSAREPECGANPGLENGVGLGEVGGRACELQRPCEEPQERRRVRAADLPASP